MKKLIKIINYIIISILVLLILVNGYFLISKLVFKNDLPKLFGFCAAEIRGGSMQPTLEYGDYVVYYTPDEYEVNDIVLYRDSDNNLVTHRIVEIDETGYIIAGDYTQSKEPGIEKDRIEAKYLFKLPKIFNFFRKPVGIIIVIVIGLIIVEIPNFIESIKKRNKIEKEEEEKE